MPVNALFFLASARYFFYTPPMSLHDFLTSTFWFLVTAVFFVPLFKRLRLGALLGYIAAGAAIGPWGFKLINDVEVVAHYAELGVVFLLFVIGLELRPQKLWSMRRSVFGLGALQVFVTSLILALMGRVLGLSWTPAVVCAFSLSLTSTAFALQTLTEKNQLQTDFGRESFSVLLFQDLVAIPALALIPLLSLTGEQALASFSGVAVARVVLVIVFVILCGRFLLRPILRMVAWTQTREIFTATGLLFVIGVAMMMESQGLSMSLGAFLAGVLLADSEYRHEIESDIEPFKGLLLGLFFISVGLSLNFGIVYQKLGLVLFLTIVLMVAKMIVNYALGRYFKLPIRSAQNFSVVLAPAGEFAFVIFAVAQQNKLLSADLVSVLVAAVTLSMVLTPFLFILKERFGDMFFDQTPVEVEFDRIQNDSPQVIIAGFGRVGQITGRLLRVLWIPFTALELDGEQVQVVRRFGNKVYYGDASRLDLLHAAGAKDAEIFVLAIDDPESSVKIAETVKKHFPHLKIVARARNRQHAFDLMDVGVTSVFRETFASSLEMAELVLKEIGVPVEKARHRVQTFREHDERGLQEQHKIHHDEKEFIAHSKQAVSQLEKAMQGDV